MRGSGSLYYLVEALREKVCMEYGLNQRTDIRAYCETRGVEDGGMMS